MGRSARRKKELPIRILNPLKIFWKNKGETWDSGLFRKRKFDVIYCQQILITRNGKVVNVWVNINLFYLVNASKEH